MKRYKIEIKLTDGRNITANVVGRNQADAIGRLEKTPQFLNYVGKSEIDKIDIDPIPIEPIDNRRFSVTTIDNKPGWYIVVDLDHMLKIEFKKGMYNETQRIVPFDRGRQPEALEIATVLREAGEFLHQFFEELL